MKKQEITKRINEIINNNSEIEPIFHPLIEEFFIRLSDTHQLSDSALKDKMKKLINLKHFKFKFFNDNINGYLSIPVQHDYGYFSAPTNIDINIKYLYYLLLGNNTQIEQFINSVFHELAHIVEIIILPNNSLNVGIQKNTYTFSTYDNSLTSENRLGVISNEYATIINSELLTKGNVNNSNFFMYEYIHNFAKAVYSSLGVSDIKLAELQMQSRDNYETYISQQIGKNKIADLADIESDLDQIYILLCNFFSIYSTLNNTSEMENTLKSLFEKINDKTNDFLLYRVKKLGKNPNLSLLARILIDKKIRDKHLLMAFEQFKSELPLNYTIDIKPDFLKKQLPHIDYNKLQEEINLISNSKIDLSQISYDNTELKNRLTNLALTYDTKNLPFFTQIKITILKKFANLSNKFKKKNEYLTSSNNEDTELPNSITNSTNNVSTNIVSYKPSDNNNTKHFKQILLERTFDDE